MVDETLRFKLIAVTCAPRTFSVCLAFSYTGIFTGFPFLADFTTLCRFTY